MILDYSQKGFKMLFEITDAGSVVLRHFAKDDPVCPVAKLSPMFSIVNVHVSGDNPNDHHFFKHTGCSADFTLKYVSHTYYENELGNKLEFTLEDSKIRAVVLCATLIYELVGPLLTKIVLTKAGEIEKGAVENH